MSPAAVEAVESEPVGSMAAGRVTPYHPMMANTHRTRLGAALLLVLLVNACGGETSAAGGAPAEPDAASDTDARPTAPPDASLDTAFPTDLRAPADAATVVATDTGPRSLDAAPPDAHDWPPDTLPTADAGRPPRDPDAALDAALDAAPLADRGTPPDARDAAPDVAPDLGPPPPVEPEVPPSEVRTLAWPGGGLQVLLELPPERRAPESWPEVWVQTERQPRVQAVMESAGVTTGITVILLVPAAEPAEHLIRRVLASALLDALPPGERVALMTVHDEVVLLAESSLDRAHLRAQLAHFQREAGRSAAPWMDEVRSRIAALESRYTTPGRAVIVLGEEVGETPPGASRPVQTLSLGTVGDPAADAAALVTELQARRAALVRVAACPDLAEDEIFALHVGERSLVLSAPEPMAHLAGEVCDAVAAAADAYPYPREIALTFSPDERAVFDAHSAAASVEPFTTSVTLGLGQPIPAVAHFHGLGTLACERKSITVELDGGRRRLSPDLAASRFILISMCQDLRYFGQVFGDRVLAAMGLFPPPLKYVRLRLDGVDRGVYMMVYTAERAFRDTSLGLDSVVRRGYDIDAWPAEVKYPSDPVLAEESRLRFEAIGDLALSAPPEDLEGLLDGLLDLDAYLQLLAVFSLFENGDFIDEVFFASSLEAGQARYRAMGWDTDDLWSACHAEGARAIADRCGLTYCTEAELDQSLLRSDDVYRRYRQALATVLATLTPERLVTTMTEVQAELWGVLDSDETAAACTEMVAENPALATLDAARADIVVFMQAALDQTERRRAVLSAALAACPDVAP